MAGRYLIDRKGGENNLMNGSKLYSFVSYEMNRKVIVRMFQ